MYMYVWSGISAHTQCWHHLIHWLGCGSCWPLFECHLWRGVQCGHSIGTARRWTGSSMYTHHTHTYMYCAMSDWLTSRCSQPRELLSSCTYHHEQFGRSYHNNTISLSKPRAEVHSSVIGVDWYTVTPQCPAVSWICWSVQTIVRNTSM